MMIGNHQHTTQHARLHVRRLAALVVTAGVTVGGAADGLYAASVRVWRTGVVVMDDIHLNDVCELRGFDRDMELALHQAIVMSAPKPGTSLTLPQEAIRKALRAAGANMALVTVSGAVRCQVTRPSRDDPAGEALSSEEAQAAPPRDAADPDLIEATSKDVADAKATLRTAIVDFFSSELERYRARADVTFDRSSQPLLKLSSPPYTFRVRRHGASPLGLVAVEVDVISEGNVVQTVSLVVQVSMLRKVVVARRPINQEATIGSDDVESTELRFTRVQQIGVMDAAQVIGQRAKRFISSGSMIDPSDVESVPIIIRGQLITLISETGGVRVVTTAKAAEDGLFGDTIKVRAADNRRVEFNAVVIGAGRARVGVSSDAQRQSVSLVEAGS